MAPRKCPSELLELDAAIRASRERAATDPTPHDFVVCLRRLAERAREAGFGEQVDVRLLGSSETSHAAQHALELARLARNDHAFVTHAVAGLRLARVDLNLRPAPVVGLEFDCVTLPGGAIVGRSSAAGERELVTVTGTVRLLVHRDPLEGDAGRPLRRGSSERRGTLASRDRALRALACGTAVCTFTNRRVIGVISDSAAGSRRGADWGAAPIARTDENGGSVVVFSCYRGVFDECETRAPRLRRGTLDVNLLGECNLAIDVRGLVGSDDRVLRPRQPVIESALRAFVR